MRGNVSPAPFHDKYDPPDPNTPIGRRRLRDLEGLVAVARTFEVIHADGCVFNQARRCPCRPRYRINLSSLERTRRVWTPGEGNGYSEVTVEVRTVSALWRELRLRLVLITPETGATSTYSRRGKAGSRRPRLVGESLADFDRRWEGAKTNRSRGLVIRDAIAILAADEVSRRSWRQELLENAEARIRPEPNRPTWDESTQRYIERKLAGLPPRQTWTKAVKFGVRSSFAIKDEVTT